MRAVPVGAGFVPVEDFMDGFLFDGWATLGRTLVVGSAAYVGLVLLLRLSGKRTLSKMNAFDWVVTVALGSTLATVLLNEDVALAEGLAAFALLIALQFVVTWSSVRLPWVRKLVTGEPTLLLYRGELIEPSLRATRVTADEVRTALRSSGLRDFSQAYAVVLETDGSLNVLEPGGGRGADSALADVVLADSHQGPP